MELLKNTLSYQRKIASETVCREESTDCIVPDSQPDIARIVDVSAIALVRDREADQDEVKLRCTARAMVLYIGEDSERVWTLEVPVSYTQTIAMRGVEAHDELFCDVSIAAADARIVNPRKVTVRVNTVCRVSAYRQGEESIAAEAKANGLCTKIEKYTVKYDTAVTAKNFTLVEDIELDTESPIEQVLNASFLIEAQDVKVLAGRASVRAQATVKALYETADGEIVSVARTFGFTQSADLTAEDDNADTEVSFVLRSFELEKSIDMTGDSRYLALSAGVTMQIRTSVSRDIELLEDMYGLKRDLSYTTRELEILPYGKNRTYSSHCSERLETAESAEKIIAVRVCPDQCFEMTAPDEVMTGFMIYILYQDASGGLYGMSRRMTQRFTVEGEMSNRMVTVGEPSAVVSENSGILLEFDVSLHGEETSAPLQMIDEAVWGEEYPMDEQALSAILTRVSGTSIWDIAKAYHTTTQAIEAANPGIDLCADKQPLILIPL